METDSGAASAPLRSDYRLKRFGDFNGKLLYTYKVRKRLDPTRGHAYPDLHGLHALENVAGGRETRFEKGRNLRNLKVTR